MDTNLRVTHVLHGRSFLPLSTQNSPLVSATITLSCFCTCVESVDTENNVQTTKATGPWLPFYGRKLMRCTKKPSREQDQARSFSPIGYRGDDEEEERISKQIDCTTDGYMIDCQEQLTSRSSCWWLIELDLTMFIHKNKPRTVIMFHRINRPKLTHRNKLQHLCWASGIYSTRLCHIAS